MEVQVEPGTLDSSRSLSRPLARETPSGMSEAGNMDENGLTLSTHGQNRQGGLPTSTLELDPGAFGTFLTLSDIEHEPPSQTEKPVMSIPEPYTPLRKQASHNLRLRTPSTTGTDLNSEQKTMGQMARLLRPETSRWSQASTVSHKPDMEGFSPHSEQQIVGGQQASVEGDNADESESDTLSPLTRRTTSTSDRPNGRGAKRTVISNEATPELSSPLRASFVSSPGLPANFWRNGGASSIRESILSSTPTDFSSVAHTSTTTVWTERSSRTTYDSPTLEVPRVSDDALSVDDCIAMYAEGFRDDPIMEEKRSCIRHIPATNEASLVTQSKRDSMNPPVVLDKADDDVGANNTPAKSSRSSETLGDSTLTPTSPMSPASQRQPPKIPRDFYGFKQDSQYVTLNRYTAWHRNYQVHLDRRKKKWVYLMNSHGLPNQTFPVTFPPRSQEVKRYIRKGIPPEWRGAAWFFYGDGAGFLQANEGLFDRLKMQLKAGALPEHYRDMIERDLNRTFPDNIYFKPESPSTLSADQSSQREPDMITSLRVILQAFAIHRPKVGYCQSLNFLAGFLLLFMRLSFRSGNYEERAFAMLCILTDKYLPGTHGVVLEGCNVDIGVLMTMLQETMPNLMDKLNNTGRHSTGSGGISNRNRSRTSVTLQTGTEDLPTVSLATTAWFMSCFVSTLPVETVCRVWDCLWFEGSKTIFRVALAIFKLSEKQIMKTSDPAEVFQIVQSLPRGLLDANELMEVATMKGGRVGARLGSGTPGFGGLSQDTVENRRHERRAFAKVANGPQDGTAEDTPPVFEVAEASPGLKRSKTRGTLKRLKSFRRPGRDVPATAV